MGVVELPASIYTAVHAAQPLAVLQAGTGEVDCNGCALQAFDGFGEKTVGGLIVGQQSSSVRQDTQAPVSSAGTRPGLEPLHGLRRGFLVADASRSFDQLEQAPTVEPEVVVFTAVPRGGVRILVAAEPVVEHGREESRQTEHTAFSPTACVCGRCLDGTDRFVGNPPPRSQGQ